MNQKGKDMDKEKEQEMWAKHLRAVEVARTLVREETELWRENFGLTGEEYTASALAMEMQLFALSLDAPMSAGGLDTVEFFCELTGVDFSHIMEIMNNAITYGRAVVAAEESSD